MGQVAQMIESIEWQPAANPPTLASQEVMVDGRLLRSIPHLSVLVKLAGAGKPGAAIAGEDGRFRWPYEAAPIENVAFWAPMPNGPPTT